MRSSTTRTCSPALVLHGHIDVVPPGDPAVCPEPGPYGAHADQGLVDGRGACDLKAGLVANLGVVLALRRARVLRALAELERDRNADPDPRFAGRAIPDPLTVGTVRAGDSASAVPHLLVAEGAVRSAARSAGSRRCPTAPVTSGTRAPGEQVPIGELVGCTRAVALLAARRCGLT